MSGTGRDETAARRAPGWTRSRIALRQPALCDAIRRERAIQRTPAPVAFDPALDDDTVRGAQWQALQSGGVGDRLINVRVTRVDRVHRIELVDRSGIGRELVLVPAV